MRKRKIAGILLLSLSLCQNVYATQVPEPAAVETEAEAPTDVTVPETINPETVNPEMAESETVNPETMESETAETIPETNTPPTIAETSEAESEEDSIQEVDDSRLDENGRVAVNVTFPQDAVFPYRITLSGSEGNIEFEIKRNGQQLLIKPDTYTVKEAINGKNKKLPKGAELTIKESTENIYLDFTKPEGLFDLSLSGMFITNVVFLILAGIAYMLFKKFREYMGD